MDQQESKKQTIALCMIVKNEQEVILRALNSVKNIVDYYCICDTGSTDNTVAEIENYLKENNLDGEVHRRPWVNFAHNRSEALRYAEEKGCDFFMTLDADEVFAVFDGNEPVLNKRIFSLPELSGDRIHVRTYTPGLTYQRAQFFRREAGPWKWVSPVHEVCVSDNEKIVQNLEGVCIIPTTDGARARDGNRFLWDAFEFEKAVRENPADPRLWFYMGQSYQDCGRHDQALSAYQTCIDKTRWAEEKSTAYLRMARIINNRDGFDKALPLYWKSYEANPKRGEALYDMLAHYRKTGEFHCAVVVGELFMKCDPSDALLFVETPLYKWKAKDELSIALHYVGRSAEAAEMLKSILDYPRIPAGELDRLKNNLTFMED